MLIGHQQPLSIAATVLKPTTMQAVRRSPSFHLQGWKILDRWAFNNPRKLRKLEAEGEVILLGRLLNQQTTEHEALARWPMGYTATEYEILEASEIKTEL